VSCSTKTNLSLSLQLSSTADAALARSHWV
jgi:hypothetical protein